MTAAGTHGDWEVESATRHKCGHCDFLQNHTLTVTAGTNTATCTAAGTEEVTCSVCDFGDETEDQIRTRATTALGHNYTGWTVTTAATCTTPATETGTCSRCPATNTREGAGALGHDLGAYTISTAPSCTATGEEAADCSRCSYVDRRPVNALDHAMSAFTTTTAPTCLSAGVETSTCTRSGCQVSATNVLPALGHSFGDYAITTAPTCTAAGVETRTCTRNCGEAGASETRAVAALGHAWGNYAQTLAPTCLVAGSEEANCTRCTATDTRAVAATGHAMGAWLVTTAPTCTEAGVETQTCTNADCTEAAERPVNATGHAWGSWAVTTEATTATEGVETRACSACGAEETRSIPVLPQPPAPPAEFIPEEVVFIILEEDAPVINLSEVSGTKISAELLQAIAESGKDVEVVLESGFSFTILADSIDPDAVTAFDLDIAIELTSRATVIDDVKIPANSLVISPNVVGDFGFDIQFTFTAAQLADAGIRGNNIRLFHIDHDGTVTDMGRVRLLSDGSIEFTISHASYYVLSAEDLVALNDDNNPDTGVTVIGLMTAMMAGGTAIIAKKRRRKK